MIELPTTTLWSCVWSDNPGILYFTVRALKHCCRLIHFQDVTLFSSIEVKNAPSSWRVIKIPILTPELWNVFHIKTVPEFIKTDYAVSVHEDGFPIMPELWTDSFLNYDYIGAPWDIGMCHNNKVPLVGNGGFCMESKKFLEAKKNLSIFEIKDHAPSDVCVCFTHKAEMDAKGVKYAPVDLALRFATETIGNDKPSFGFHGRNNPKYDIGWETVERFEQIEIVESHKITVEIVYILVVGIHDYIEHAKVFVGSYLQCPPLYPHKTTIVCNLGIPNQQIKDIFNPLPNVRFVLHDNSGYDIGGFQKAARESSCDMMVFFGATTYFNGAGWLKRAVESFVKHGDALYGTMGNNGDEGVNVNRHIRSTAFWMSPSLMNQYPIQIKSKSERYQFEHGKSCITEWALQQGVKALVVSRENEYEWPHWDEIPNGFHRGDQSSLLIGDHISRPPFYPPEKK